MKSIKTWLQLYEKLGKQPLSKTRDKIIILKKDDKVIPLHLVYNENGTDWWLEEDTNDDEVMD